MSRNGETPEGRVERPMTANGRLVIRHPPSNDGVGDAGGEEADGEAEEGSDHYVSEIVGCHHYAAQGN